MIAARTDNYEFGDESRLLWLVLIILAVSQYENPAVGARSFVGKLPPEHLFWEVRIPPPGFGLVQKIIHQESHVDSLILPSIT